MQIQVPYLQSAAVIVNQAMDALGQPAKVIGDISDGTDVSEAARRNYGQALRQLLRTAHWPFARKYAQLDLLGDASGQSEAPISTIVECPWAYAYAWPIDAVQGRWMPYSYTNGVPETSTGVPLTTGQAPLTTYPQMPGRFLVSSSNQYPIEVGQVPWDQQPDLQRTEGLGPTNRKIILSNCANAFFVYTRLVPVIEEWDDLFRQAMVGMMALALAPVAIDDPKERITQRNMMIPIVKNAVIEARIAGANEAGYPQGVDHLPIWMTARGGGFWGGLGADGQGFSGYTFYPWDASMSWCGSVY